MIVCGPCASMKTLRSRCKGLPSSTCSSSQWSVVGFVLCRSTYVTLEQVPQVGVSRQDIYAEYPGLALPRASCLPKYRFRTDSYCSVDVANGGFSFGRSRLKGGPFICHVPSPFDSQAYAYFFFSTIWLSCVGRPRHSFNLLLLPTTFPPTWPRLARSRPRIQHYSA